MSFRFPREFGTYFLNRFYFYLEFGRKPKMDDGDLLERTLFEKGES